MTPKGRTLSTALFTRLERSEPRAQGTVRFAPWYWQGGCLAWNHHLPIVRQRIWKTHLLDLVQLELVLEHLHHFLQRLLALSALLLLQHSSLPLLDELVLVLGHWRWVRRRRLLGHWRWALVLGLWPVGGGGGGAEPRCVRRRRWLRICRCVRRRRLLPRKRTCVWKPCGLCRAHPSTIPEASLPILLRHVAAQAQHQIPLMFTPPALDYTRRLIVYGKLRRWRLHRCNLDGYRPVPLGRVGSGMVVEYAASSFLVLRPARWQIRRCSGGWCGCCGWQIRWWHLEHCARSRAALECLHLLLSRHLTSGSVARLECYVEIRHPLVEAHCTHSTFLRHSLHHVLSWAVGSAALSPC